MSPTPAHGMPESLAELVKAVRSNDLQQLSQLLATVSDIGVRSPAGRTPLHFAAEEANLDAVRLCTLKTVPALEMACLPSRF